MAESMSSSLVELDGAPSRDLTTDDSNYGAVSDYDLDIDVQREDLDRLDAKVTQFAEDIDRLDAKVTALADDPITEREIAEALFEEFPDDSVRYPSLYACYPDTGFHNLFYVGQDNPLRIWEKQTWNGYVQRMIDDDDIAALRIVHMSKYKSTEHLMKTFITAPCHPFRSLGIRLPYFSMTVKNVNQDFMFRILIRDTGKVRRTLFFNTRTTTAKRNALIAYIPLRLEPSWNQLFIDLAAITQTCFRARYSETVRIQIFPNCRLRMINFVCCKIPIYHEVAMLRQILEEREREVAGAVAEANDLDSARHRPSQINLVPEKLEDYLSKGSVNKQVTEFKKMREARAKKQREESPYRRNHISLREQYAMRSTEVLRNRVALIEIAKLKKITEKAVKASIKAACVNDGSKKPRKKILKVKDKVAKANSKANKRTVRSAGSNQSESTNPEAADSTNDKAPGSTNQETFDPANERMTGARALSPTSSWITDRPVAKPRKVKGGKKALKAKGKPAVDSENNSCLSSKTPSGLDIAANRTRKPASAEELGYRRDSVNLDLLAGLLTDYPVYGLQAIRTASSLNQDNDFIVRALSGWNHTPLDSLYPAVDSPARPETRNRHSDSVLESGSFNPATLAPLKLPPKVKTKSKALGSGSPANGSRTGSPTNGNGSRGSASNKPRSKSKPKPGPTVNANPIDELQQIISSINKKANLIANRRSKRAKSLEEGAEKAEEPVVRFAEETVPPPAAEPSETPQELSNTGPDLPPVGTASGTRSLLFDLELPDEQSIQLRSRVQRAEDLDNDQNSNSDSLSSFIEKDEIPALPVVLSNRRLPSAEFSKLKAMIATELANEERPGRSQSQEPEKDRKRKP